MAASTARLRTVRSRITALGMTREQIFNLPVLFYFPFNGILQNPAKSSTASAASMLFGILVLILITRNRFHVRWQLWTFRIAAIMVIETLLSVTWSVQPLISMVYPCAVSVLTFFYCNYLLDIFPKQEVIRLLVWIFGTQMVLCVLFALFVPSLGIDSGLGDPNNAGAWQGIFAQKNLLGMSTTLAFAVGLSFKPQSSLDRLWRGLLFGSLFIAAAGSRSREAWAAIAFQGVIFAAVWLLARFERRIRLPMLTFGAVLASLLASLLYSNLDAILALIGRSRTASGRAYIWEGAFLLIQRKPLLGYGVYGVWHTPVAWEVVARAGWNVPSSHNNFIEVLLYYGIVGLVFLGVLFLIAIVLCIRALLRHHTTQVAPTAYLVSGILILSIASPITTYYPSAALLLLTYFTARLEQELREGRAPTGIARRLARPLLQPLAFYPAVTHTTGVTVPLRMGAGSTE